MTHTESTAPPNKIWLSRAIVPYLNGYKGRISETRNGFAIRTLVEIGLQNKLDGRYGLFLKEKCIPITGMEQYSVRISTDFHKKVKSYGGSIGLNIGQAYFDLVCTGMHFDLFVRGIEKRGLHMLPFFD